MSKQKSSYFESLIDTEVRREENQITLSFQRERIGLKSPSVVQFLSEVEPEIPKAITTTDDELIITASIPELHQPFEALRQENMKTRWIFAHQLIEKVEKHPYDRITLAVCPENIVYNTGMTPYFIHYGMIDALPPMEKNPDRVWVETKAAVAAAVSNSRTFDDYIKYQDALPLNAVEQSILSAKDPEELRVFCKKQIQLIEENEKRYIKLPKKKWKSWKITAISLGALLVPALIFVCYYFIYTKPTTDAYMTSHHLFLAHWYSEVVTTLEPLQVNKMPYVVLYEAALSYVTNERLDEEQKKNVLSNITLQTDEDYLKYWIYIGRAEAEEAVDLARSMEDGELIVYGLLKRREEIQADRDLTGEEKQQLLQDIDHEVEEYEKLMVEEEDEE
ncbi:type VII secretion protein EssB [Sporosarcina cyprini]|uniref:type VII secretion protein EssB n=1 Tax=Sporosarcina cyprini TaxID=2910523 RepID=UPI001EE11C5B|nr:type VII secretion protein EssB [Sporosarcina cyprini]MCG3089833.1 type VII secretion protein EssB [Sporosarcina cyprini]